VDRATEPWYRRTSSLHCRVQAGAGPIRSMRALATRNAENTQAVSLPSSRLATTGPRAAKEWGTARWRQGRHRQARRCTLSGLRLNAGWMGFHRPAESRKSHQGLNNTGRLATIRYWGPISARERLMSRKKQLFTATLNFKMLLPEGFFLPGNLTTRMHKQQTRPWPASGKITLRSWADNTSGSHGNVIRH